MRRLIGPMMLVLLVAACGKPPAADEPPPVVRNVTALDIKAAPFKVDIKLPCLTKPREIIELRAARQGRIANFPFKEGDEVPASQAPSEVENLDLLKPVARIDDRDLQVMLADRTTRKESAERALKRVKDYKDSTSAQIDQAQTALDLAVSDLRSTEQMIRDTYVTSPYPGTLTRRLRQKDEFVNQGELIAIVAVLNPMVINLDVPGAHFARVKQGDELTVTFDTLSGLKRAAKVKLMDKVAHAQTHTFRAEMEMDNADGKVPAGIFGSLMLTIYDKQDAIVVPLDAIKLEGGSKWVMILTKEGTAQKRAVEIGQFAAMRVEITSGLKPGERIAVLGARLLNDGDRYAVQDDPGKN